jgi:hypothetical protein
MSDQDIQKLESEFPPLSGSAFAAARKQALDAGLSVVESDNGVIYETFPDGSRKLVKKIDPPTPVVTGSIFTIR